MHLRCPHCRNPIELVDDGSLDDVSCPSCGSSFSLISSTETQTFQPDSVKAIGHFELRDQLGIGAFGAVWRAHDTELDRTVAVKIPRKGQLDGEEAEKFLREARAAAQLNHPGIVCVHEVGRDDHAIYIVSDFIDGLTLTDWLSGQKPTPREAAELCIKIAEALHHAHEQGVIHRDLKPGNVMLDRDNEPHLMDFGLAKREAGEITMTMDGQVLGTPAYMSPEQARGEGHAVDRRTDVYSLGVILFELMTGERPFRGNSRMLLHQLLTEDPPSPRKLNSGIPKDLETICLKCLRREPSRRYASAIDAAADLQRWVNRQPIVARPVSRAERLWLWCKRNPAIAGSAAAIFLTASVVAGVVWRVEEHNLLERIQTAVETMAVSRGEAVPLAIQILEMDGFRREVVVPELQGKFTDVRGNEKLGLAYALAHFGDVRSDYLVEQVAGVPPSEAANLITALQHSAADSLKEIATAIEACEEDQDWTTKARLAITAMVLGDDAPAAAICQLAPDPIQRTIFIEELSTWHGDLVELGKIAKTISAPDLRSAVGLGIGDVPAEARALVPDAALAWESVLAEWYENQADSGTHSAAGYALRKWDLDEPTVEPAPVPAVGSDWHVNALGMTMLRIPAGQFIRKTTAPDPDDSQKTIERDQTVVLSEFLLSDREVTIALFHQFVDDPDYPEEERPREWGGEREFPDATPEHPVQQVSWYDAVLFCNWASHRSGRKPCYERTGENEKVPAFRDGKVVEVEFDAWQLVESANGYRLPTEAEWEYACRAGTATAFHTGDDESRLAGYCTSLLNSSSQTAAAGSRLSNGWGLFDMHGNVWELCHDWHGQYGSDPQAVNPRGPSTGSNRVRRGGSWLQVAGYSRSSFRVGGSPAARGNAMGFRVASSVQRANE